MERMTKIDENIQTAQNMLSGIVERCYELEEENKNLKEENLLQLSEIRRLREYLGEYKMLKKENRKLREELFILKRNTKYNRLQDKLVFDDSKTAREEQLKLDTRFMEEDTLQELRDLGEI